MNEKDIIFEINKKIKNDFLIYINNEFIKTIEIVKNRELKNIENKINNQNNFNYILKLFKHNLILQVDNDFYNDTKKELFNFVKKKSNNIFNDEQLIFITNKFFNFYYPSIKQKFINYINNTF